MPALVDNLTCAAISVPEMALLIGIRRGETGEQQKQVFALELGLCPAEPGTERSDWPFACWTALELCRMFSFT